MEYQIIDKQHVANSLVRYGVKDGDEIIVGQYLTMRDQEAQKELWCALHECLDEMGMMDVLVMGEPIPIPCPDPKGRSEYDFQIRWWRHADDDDISYRDKPKRSGKKRLYRL